MPRLKKKRPKVDPLEAVKVLPCDFDRLIFHQHQPWLGMVGRDDLPRKFSNKQTPMPKNTTEKKSRNTPNTRKPGRITAVSMERLYNTGNYTNVKYSLTAEVPKGSSARETLVQLAHVLSHLKPIPIPHCLQELKTARNIPEDQRSPYVKEKFIEWEAEETQWKIALAERNQAIADLDLMGGSRTSKDAKLDWDDQDVPW